MTCPSGNIYDKENDISFDKKVDLTDFIVISYDNLHFTYHLSHP